MMSEEISRNFWPGGVVHLIDGARIFYPGGMALFSLRMPDAVEPSLTPRRWPPLSTIFAKGCTFPFTEGWKDRERTSKVLA
jgi:hypothetical protein